jgi:cytochrome c-type biogenesis protein
MSFGSSRRRLASVVLLVLAGAGALAGAGWRGSWAAHHAVARADNGAATCDGACALRQTGAAARAAPMAAPGGGKPRLLEFESSTCAVCARLAPVVKAIEARCAAGAGVIVRVQVDDEPGQAIAERYGVRALPTFLSVDALDEEVERSVGDQPGQRIARMLAEVRGEACATPL